MLEAGQGLGGPIPLPEDVAEIVVKRRISSVSPNRQANALDRIVRASGLVLEQPEQMEGLRVTGVHRQDLMANPLCFSHSASALISQRAAEPAGDRRRRIACRAPLPR